jgi:primosomal protein N' (replication factor Y)
VALVNVVLSGLAESAVARLAGETAEWFGSLVIKHQLPVVVLGPAPCPIAKIKDRFRWHVLLKGPGEAIGRVVRYAAPRLDGTATVRLAIDRDPANLL